MTEMIGTILQNQRITFYPSEAAASALAEKVGGEADGYVVAPAVGRPGWFVIRVVDTDDGYFLGYL